MEDGRRRAVTHRRGIVELLRAFDEARFGPDRTLNLRAMQPTVKEAERRAEAWLRERQVAQSEEVLVITGRGAQSWDGVSAVREAIAKLLASLKRRGVVNEFVEHTAGSFVIRLATVAALRSTPSRLRERPPVPPADPAALAALAPETRQLLRELAMRTLEELGVRDAAQFADGEMLRQFSLIAAGIPNGVDREPRLREAIVRELES